MKKRKRHYIKMQKRNIKKRNLIGPIVLTLEVIVGCIVSFFKGKLINDGGIGNILVFFSPIL